MRQDFPSKERSPQESKSNIVDPPASLENCQVGVFAAYASAYGATFLDRELYLPSSVGQRTKSVVEKQASPTPLSIHPKRNWPDS